MASNKASNIAIAREVYDNRKVDRPKQKFNAKTKTWSKVKTRKFTKSL